MQLALFIIFGALALAGALNLLLQRHPIHSALSLVVVMMSLAVLYWSLGAEFLAAAQVIVYSGAIMVLFVFVIMLLNAGEEEHTHGSRAAYSSASPAPPPSSACSALSSSPSAARSSTNIGGDLSSAADNIAELSACSSPAAAALRGHLHPDPRGDSGRSRARAEGAIAWPCHLQLDRIFVGASSHLLRAQSAICARRGRKLMVPTAYYLVLAAMLFSIGIAAFLIKRNVITIFISIELMLNAVNLTFVAFAHMWHQVTRPDLRLLRDGGRRRRGRGRTRHHHRHLPHAPDAERRRDRPDEIMNAHALRAIFGSFRCCPSPAS